MVGDFSSDISPYLQGMLASKDSFSVDEFIEEIITGYEFGSPQKSLLQYIEKLSFDSLESTRIREALADYIKNEIK